MARRPRSHVSGGLFHVTSRGNRGEKIFTAGEDAERFLSLLTKVVEKREWRCHAYCLMPNHYHLMVDMPGPTLSTGMHELNWRYAYWFNLRHGFTGHLFQERFGSRAIVDEPHALESSRYIPLNPVRAGLCARPEMWPWSSYRATLRGPAPALLDREWLLSRFAPNKARARELYERFVLDGLASDAAISW